MAANEEKSAIQIVQECYSAIPELRAAIQLIPVVGGSIDTLIVGRTSQIQIARIEDFVRRLTLRLERVERSSAKLTDEAFSDLVATTFESVARSRSATKRERFAEILARQVTIAAPWEEAESAIRLLSELDEIHITVLALVLNAQPAGEPFEGLKVISPAVGRHALRSEVGAKMSDPLYLPQRLPQYTPLALRMASVDLLSRGLLHDEDIGRWGTKNLEFLIPTEMAEWFASWIRLKAVE